MPPYDDDLALALALADAADAVTMARFRAADLVVDSKPDLTPVSDADKAAERVIRERLERERPSDDVLGEEEGFTPTGTSRRWVLDPIDGTKGFVRGLPVWGTLVALQVDERSVVGVVSAPALGRRWWAATGSGAHTSDLDGTVRRLAVSKVAHMEDAQLSFSAMAEFETQGLLPAYEELSRRAWRMRDFGDFWQHMLVAEGGVDAACDPVAAIWDAAALQPVVEEAGGRFTDTSGRNRPDGGSGLSSNGLLHDELLAALAAHE